MFDNQTTRRVFFHDCDDDLAAWAVSRLRPQGSRPFTEPSPLRVAGAPSEVVLTDDDRRRDLVVGGGCCLRLARTRATMLPGSHSPFLLDPTALADVLVELANSFT